MKMYLNIIIVILLGILIIPLVMKSTNINLPQNASPKKPTDIINLTSWKLTLPTGDNEKPDEIKQSALNNFQISPWFMINEKENAVQFRAPVNGVTTSGSNYPRSELREMNKDGKTNASWSSNVGIHKMIIDEAITAVPQTKTDVVAGQIHDDSDDVIVIRLEYPTLYVNVDGENKYILDDDYKLGKRFTIEFIVQNNQTSVYYNGSKKPVYTLNKNYSDAYFKAGAYTQSNCSKEAKNQCIDSNYGEVILYNVQVDHK